MKEQWTNILYNKERTNEKANHKNQRWNEENKFIRTKKGTNEQGNCTNQQRNR